MFALRSVCRCRSTRGVTLRAMVMKVIAPLVLCSGVVISSGGGRERQPAWREEW